MSRSLAVCLGALLAAAPAFAATSPAAPAAPATSKTAPKPVAKPAAAKPKPAVRSTKRPAQESEAKGLAVAEDVVEQITTTQLDIAGRVLTGDAECEFNQKVTIAAEETRPGMFRVVFNKRAFLMVPEETTTGAVRLADRRNGVMWLQIPSKSMLFDSKGGQRLVDACTQTEQRVALQAAATATTSLLSPALAPPPSVAPADAGSPVALSGAPAPEGAPASAPAP